MKKLIFLILVILAGQWLQASECYNYHTSTKHAIIKNERGIFYQFTEKDPNGFSYVVQKLKPLRGVDLASYKLYGEDEDVFVFADKAGVYSLRKDEQYEGNTAKFYKILNINEASKNINGRLFLIHGKWNYIDNWQNKITKTVFPDLPVNIVNIKSWRSGFYVKDDKNVYAIKFDLFDKKHEITILPSLTPNQTVYYSCLPSLNEDYLADQNSMFSIRKDGDFEDITPQLLAMGFSSGYNAMKLIEANIPIWQSGNLILKKRDGASSTRTNPLTGEEIDVQYAYSSAKLLQPQADKNSYVLFKNNIYPIWDDNFSLPAKVNVNASELHAVEDNLFVGKNYYYMGNHDNFNLANTTIAANAKFYPTVSSYGAYLPKALADDKFIYFIGDNFDYILKNKQALTSKVVKQLGMFYLFNNALFDGEKSYPIIADYETLSYLGSFVEVINGCSSDMADSEQVKVKYHHFFKDENAVYYFDEKAKKLQLIQTANVDDYQADNYEDMQTLYKIKDVKGSVKKKTNQANTNLNYVWIGGACFVVFMLALFYFKKEKKW